MGIFWQISDFGCLVMDNLSVPSISIEVLVEAEQFLFGIFFSFSTSKNGSNQSKQRSRYCGKCQCFVRCRLRLSRTNNRHLSWAWNKSVIILLIINFLQPLVISSNINVPRCQKKWRNLPHVVKFLWPSY